MKNLNKRHFFNSGSIYGFLAFIIPLITFTFSLRYYDYTYGFNVLATQYSMWSYHSFNLGTISHPIYNGTIPNVDTVVVNGKYFDTYAPGLEFLGFPFSVIGFILDGNALKPQGNAIIMLEFFVALSASIACYITYRICLFYARRLPSLICGLTLGLATSVWPFAVVIFPHDTSMLLSLSSVFFALSYLKEKQAKTSVRGVSKLALAGLLLGAASFTDYLATLLIFPMTLFVYFSSKGRRSAQKSNVSLGFPLLISIFLVSGPCLVFLYNYYNFGGPFIFPEEFYKFASPNERSLGGLAMRFHLGYIGYAALYNLVSPYRGLLIFSPVLVLGLYGLYKILGSKDFRQDGLLFVSFFLTIFISYSAWSDWSGGASYGPRFIVPSLPYLVIPITVVLENSRKKISQAIFYALFCGSSFTCGMGAMVNSTPPVVFPPPILDYQLASYILPKLSDGKVGMWWLERIGAISNTGIDLAAVSFVLVLAVASVGYLVFKNVRDMDSSKWETQVVSVVEEKEEEENVAS
jgi:hypothetical protein